MYNSQAYCKKKYKITSGILRCLIVLLSISWFANEGKNLLSTIPITKAPCASTSLLGHECQLKSNF
jgi:hypothetical protein